MTIGALSLIIRDGAVDILKARPFSIAIATIFLGGLTWRGIQGGNRASNEGVRGEFLTSLGAMGAYWLVVRELEPYLLARPVSGGLLAYEGFRLVQNASPWQPETDPELATAWDRWSRLGFQDIGILLFAAYIGLSGPRLFIHRFLTWVR
ncbi:MAG: hypothetical protein AB7F31_02260 [Parachlamydiales bacterium]